MKRGLVIICVSVIVLGTVLELATLWAAPVTPLPISLILINCIALALVLPFKAVIGLGVVQGLLADSFWYGSGSIYTVAIIVSIVLLHWLRRSWFKQTNLPTQFLLSLLAYATGYCLLVLAARIFFTFGSSVIDPWLQPNGSVLFGGIVLGATISVLVAKIYDRFV
ncbi:MAG: hypothetical protein HYV33_00370 [Candidatus Kerfeldbacteria bacterium]|nr:hypothetical protein [Candidatus Kerfeldbacteria bacterium]